MSTHENAPESPMFAEYLFGDDDLRQAVQEQLQKICTQPRGNVRVSPTLRFDDGDARTIHTMYKNYLGFPALFPEGAVAMGVHYELQPLGDTNEGELVPHVVLSALVTTGGQFSSDKTGAERSYPLPADADDQQYHMHIMNEIAGDGSLFGDPTTPSER